MHKFLEFIHKFSGERGKMDYIEIKGANTNNLKDVSVKIPKKQITIFTGVSGSGKSSLVFETVATESARLLTETFPSFVRNFLPKYTRPDVEEISGISPSIIVDQKRIGGNSRSTVGTITDIDPMLRLLFSRVGTPSAGSMTHFSFNDPLGMCETCQGIGRVVTIDIEKAIDPEKSLEEGAILLPGYGVGNWQYKAYANSGFFDITKKIKDYTEEEYNKLMFAPPEKRKAEFAGDEMNLTYQGLVPKFEANTINNSRESSEKTKSKIAEFTKETHCSTCNGTRYNQKVLACQIDGKNIADFTSMEAKKLLTHMDTVTFKGADDLLKNLKDRLSDLVNIGLDYISLNRETGSLSGGESQRIKMVKNLASALTDMIFIFDEPSIGLHPRDVHRLDDMLVKIRDKGNTVIVVEHDPDVIKVADYIVDMGPKAGRHGGNITYQGNYEGLSKSDTLTGQALQRSISINTTPRPATEFLKTKESQINNLKNVSLSIPKGLFTVVTGVAGSGKSSLVHGVFAKEYKEAIVIDQSAVGANVRSNPATYTGVMDHIRAEFAAETGQSASLFSFNSEGKCEECNGLGYKEVNLSYMDAIKSTCEVCNGTRFKPEVLTFTVGGINIHQVMSMTISEAVEVFTKKEIKSKLKTMIEVGLGYLTLGQPLSTLSGGECQRLKLAKELTKKGNIYIMDEPTTGLHFSDIDTILEIIDKLVSKGNTVITIEHNLDIIRRADWVIDMGPEAGSGGGEIIFEGTVEQLKTCKTSLTAKYV